MKQNKETVPPAGPVADSHITSQTGWFEDVAIHWTNVPGSTAYPSYSPNAREEKSVSRQSSCSHGQTMLHCYRLVPPRRGPRGNL